MMIRVLVIVPHPDDEINIAAQMIIEMNKANTDIYIVYTTNGDAQKKIGNKRIREAIDALQLINVKESHIIFLGYANDWQNGRHIFMAEDDEVVTSACGKTETNSIESHAEYCMKKWGVHHSFTRKNYKEDIKNVIYDIMPNLIVCVDFDLHPDHRATSLIFEEVMGEILKHKQNYHPIVLKKFLYNGVWFGEKDYYTAPFQRTKKGKDVFYSGCEHELEAPCFRWNERLSFETDTATKTKYIHKNIVYKMAKKHRSTIAWYQMQRVINDDITYWYRPTQNYMHYANISATSGNTDYLNDFILYGYRDIMDEEEPFLGARNLWIPNDHDLEKGIYVSFNMPEEVKYINIYEDCNKKNHINKLKIVINRTLEYFIEPDITGAVTCICLNQPLRIESIDFFIEDYIGIPGIAEIEILPADAYCYKLPLKLYGEDGDNEKQDFDKLSTGMKLEKLYMDFCFLFRFKISYEAKHKILKKWTIWHK